MGLQSAVILQSLGSGVCYNPIHCPVCPLPMMGVVISGVGTKKIGGLDSACVTGMVLAYCGHVGILVTGSNTVKAAGLAQCTIGSQFVGDFTGVLITGASVNHMTG